MADRKQDLIGRLADLSEETIQRLADAPGGNRVVGAVNGLRARVDELQKRTRAIDGIEKRLATLEKRVDALAKTKTSTTPARPRSSAGSRASTPKRSTPKKP
jgi:hypothetical protein